MEKAYIELSKGPEPDAVIRMSIVLRTGKANAYMTEDEAQTLSNRLQSLAKSQGGGAKEVLFK